MLLTEAPVRDLVGAQVHGHAPAQQSLDLVPGVQVEHVADDVDGGVERRLVRVRVSGWSSGSGSGSGEG